MNVSRETQGRLDVIAAQLLKWQPKINLVAPSTLKDYRTRHIADSLQLVHLAPQDVRRWVDLGSGGGFPGLVVAACLADRADARVLLVESNAKKCAFLRETSRLAGLPVDVQCGRIEDIKVADAGSFEVVSARALAPLSQLLSYSEVFLKGGALGLFPKGQDVDDELEVVKRDWNISYDLIQSMTEPRARIVRVQSAQRRVP